MGGKGSIKGYVDGIGAMQAEERTAASEKGYVNGIRAMCEKDWRPKLSKLAKDRFAPGGDHHESDPFNAYLHCQAMYKPKMRYKNDPKISGQGMYLHSVMSNQSQHLFKTLQNLSTRFGG